MDGAFWDRFWDRLKDLYLGQDGKLEAFAREKPILEMVLKPLAETQLEGLYDFEEPIGRGGAGIVIRVRDKRLGLNRALKIPRPRAHGLQESVKNEIEHLRNIKHPNIISIYTMGEVEVPEMPAFPFFVMEYVDDAQDMRQAVLKLLDSAKESKELPRITGWIADKFFRVATAIELLHRRDIIHFDIKPSNILIDPDAKPVLSDLGFAKRASGSETQVVVGFTLFYAHPDLRIEYRQMSSKDRVRKEEAPRNFKKVWDIYSFGKSLLEILALVDQKFPEAVVYDYTFLYLHLAACRMLDGRNMSQEETERIMRKQLQNRNGISVYKETWLEFGAQEFEELSYSAFSDVRTDFEKLLARRHFLDSVPELNAFLPKRVQIAEGIPAPFSERVRRIVSHPVFSRLADVPQLGLVSKVYPTATHTRLEHSIGAFRNCCLYIQSLYNDPYNPLFKQLINEADIKCVLVASLLHDLGQYPLAHELGEAGQDFRHEEVTLKLLRSPTVDDDNCTLRDIITDPDGGWGVDLGYVEKILEPESKRTAFFGRDLKARMLSSVIDSPIDVDKLDYLLRDGSNCFLKYGQLIDVDRLIRNLTVIIYKDEHARTSLTIGTYEKGQSAAEALTFARYLLYQSVYWHHAARAVRAMLREAVAPALLKQGTGKRKSFAQALLALLGVQDDTKCVTIENILNLIKRYTDDHGRDLITMVQKRDYYKRILTVHSYPLLEEGKKSTLSRFRAVYKVRGFREELQRTVLEKFGNYVHTIDSRPGSILAPEKTDKVLELMAGAGALICDCPEPVYGSSDKLRFIPEPQRLQKNYFVRGTTGERVSEVWNQVYFKLMDIASKGRVFCHPEIRDAIMAALGPEGLLECLEDAMRRFEPSA